MIRGLVVKERGKPEEEKLWTAVLARAAEDACISVNNLVRHEGYSKSILRGQAVAWFKSKSADFQLVCELAGRNPDYVYTTMMKRIKADDYNPVKERARLRNEEELNEKDKKLRSLEQAWKHVRYLKYAQFFKNKRWQDLNNILYIIEWKLKKRKIIKA